MKILHLEASTGWGGQEIRILREAIGMRERGHIVHFAVNLGAKLGEHAKKEGFSVLYLSFAKKNWLSCLFKLLILIRRNQIELLNTHSSLDAWIGGIAARITGKSIVRTRHLSTPIRKGLNSKLLYHKLTDYVVTTCKAIAPVIIEQSGKPSHLCKSIPTGVEVSDITYPQDEPKQFREQMGISDDDFLVGMVCFMRSWKGVDDFIEAANLTRDVPNLKWVIIGGGHTRDYLPKVDQLDLHKTLKFSGHLTKPFGAIASLNAFCLLSTAHEGVSQASLQAAFLEKPLITTPIGGLPEVCIDKKTGYIVPPFAPKEVADKVLKLKGSPAEASEMGKNARKLVLNQFTFPKTLEEMEKAYITASNL